MSNIQTQLGQLASQLSGRAPGSLPNDTEKNPKEQVHAISLWSGKEIGAENSQKSDLNRGTEPQSEIPVSNFSEEDRGTEPRHTISDKNFQIRTASLDRGAYPNRGTDTCFV